jgi:hypothetical protein
LSQHGNKNENPVPILQRTFVVREKNAKSDHILRHCPGVKFGQKNTNTAWDIYNISKQFN